MATNPTPAARPVNPCAHGEGFCGQHGYDCPPESAVAESAPASFVLWLDASDGSVPTHDGIRWPDGTATLHHRHFGYTTTHADPEAARQSAHGKQGRLVWPAPTVSSVGQAAHATRSAEWRAAAAFVEAMNEGCGQAKPCTSCDAREDVAAELRRMADEAQPAEAHSCANCDGIDPDTCLMNPNRPPEQCPRSEADGYGLQCQKPAGHNLCTFEELTPTDPQPVRHAPGIAIRCADCRAKGRAVCMDDAVQQPKDA